MAEALLLHQRTKKQVAEVIKRPPHALLIYGPAGSGKQALAEYVAVGLLGIEATKLVGYPYYSLVQKPDNKQEISIDSVRGIIKQLQLKPVISGEKSVKRVVLIDGAHLLSAEAQNALLKAIEEPPPATIFILTATSDTAVLPTIASRAQKLAAAPVSLEEARQYFGDKYAQKDIQSAWQLSGGASGLLNALLVDDSDHPLKISIETAKKILSQNRYERILFMDSLSGDRADFINVLDALSRILAALHRSSIATGKSSQAKRLMASRKLVNSVSDSLQNNISARLAGLNLAIKLPV